LFESYGDAGSGGQEDGIDLVGAVPIVEERSTLYAAVAVIVFLVAVPIASWVHLRSGIVATLRVLVPFLILAGVAGVLRFLQRW
jgi:hypothetical protein